jgi:hypothetical protein
VDTIRIDETACVSLSVNDAKVNSVGDVGRMTLSQRLHLVRVEQGSSDFRVFVR